MRRKSKMSDDKTSREKLEEIAKRHNATIIPDKEGYVRTSGSRRQYHGTVKNGMLVYTEI